MSAKLISTLAKGAWSAVTAYTVGDIVTNNGSSYICIANSTNNEPPNASYWALLAQAGTDGIDGADGEVSLNGEQTLTNKTLTSPVITNKSSTGTDSGAETLTNKTLTSPVITNKSSTGTDSGAETLENKTLTSPVINTGVSGTAILDEDDMASDSATKLASQQSIKAYVDANAGSADGWTDSADTWVYASASTFTIAGVDRTSIYTKGTKLRFKQGAGYKYAVVLSSSFSTNTTVTILVNTDYTIANSTITDNDYSYQVNPQGYPGWFALAAPTFDVTKFDNGSGGQPSTTENRINIQGRLVTRHYKGSGVKAGTGQIIDITTDTAPLPANSTAYQAIGIGSFADANQGSIRFAPSNIIQFVSTTSITDNTSTSHFSFTTIYEI